MLLGGKSPLLGGIAQSPRTASTPLVHQNENAARLADENAPRVVKLDPPAKRRSLKALKVEEPLPAGFTIQVSIARFSKGLEIHEGVATELTSRACFLFFPLSPSLQLPSEPLHLPTPSLSLLPSSPTSLPLPSTLLPKTNPSPNPSTLPRRTLDEIKPFPLPLTTATLPRLPKDSTLPLRTQVEMLDSFLLPTTMTRMRRSFLPRQEAEVQARRRPAFRDTLRSRNPRLLEFEVREPVVLGGQGSLGRSVFSVSGRRVSSGRGRMGRKSGSVNKQRTTRANNPSLPPFPFLLSAPPS